MYIRTNSSLSLDRNVAKGNRTPFECGGPNLDLGRNPSSKYYFWIG